MDYWESRIRVLKSILKGFRTPAGWKFSNENCWFYCTKNNNYYESKLTGQGSWKLKLNYNYWNKVGEYNF